MIERLTDIYKYEFEKNSIIISVTTTRFYKSYYYLLSLIGEKFSLTRRRRISNRNCRSG